MPFLTQQRTAGLGLVEVLVSASILSMVMIATVASVVLFLRAQASHTEKLQSAYLLEEAFEAVRYLRDTGWTSSIAPLSLNTPYHLVFGGTGWEATTTPILIDGRFTRTVTFSEVYRRDSDDDIVDAGYVGAKTLDPNTRRVSFLMTWGTESVPAVSFEEGTTDSNLASFPSNNAGDGDPAQSFGVGGEDVEVAEIELLLRRAAGTTPSNVFVEIRSGSVTGTVVASSSQVMTAGLSEGSLEWVPFAISGSPVLSASTTYYLRLRSAPDSADAFSGSSGYLHWGYAQSASSPYVGGVAYRYVGRNSDPLYQGQELSQYDFSFRVNEEQEAHRLEAETYLTNFLGT